MTDFQIRELPAEETALAFEALRPLRPQVVSSEEFVERVNGKQRPEGYRLVAALPPGGGPAAAVTGFRTAHNLAWGFRIYVDDLSTLPEERGRGLAPRRSIECGAAGVWWPTRPSKPLGRSSPPLGRFDSFAAP